MTKTSEVTVIVPWFDEENNQVVTATYTFDLKDPWLHGDEFAMHIAQYEHVTNGDHLKRTYKPFYWTKD